MGIIIILPIILVLVLKHVELVLGVIVKREAAKIVLHHVKLVKNHQRPVPLAY